MIYSQDLIVHKLKTCHSDKNLYATAGFMLAWLRPALGAHNRNTSVSMKIMSLHLLTMPGIESASHFLWESHWPHILFLAVAN